MAFDLLQSHVRDLGGFSVRRLLPAARHTMVGPFIFFDHFGPTELAAGEGMSVRPHPHIGLATVTYLFEGSGLHRDSLGSVQVILPGDVNWMVAGRGIVHSERTPEADLRRARVLHGLQIWVALPREQEGCAPSFSHHAAPTLPECELAGVTLRVILGTAFGASSPVPISSPSFYVHARVPAGASLSIPSDYPERAIYPIDANVLVDGEPVLRHQMAVLEAGVPVQLEAVQTASVVLLGGNSLGSARLLNWNFVASERSLIERARSSWASYPNEQFGQIPGETEWIPLPA